MRAKDLRRGSVVLYKGAPHKVLDFEHRTPGNLHAFVQATLRNIITGIQSNTKFSSTEDLEEADVFTSHATYLYADAHHYVFMNSESYEEVHISGEVLGDGKYYLQDGMTVDLLTYNGSPVGVTLPKTVVLTVTDTEPELRGATASNSPKPATTDTGLSLNVPPFIKQGDRINVDTTEGKYLSRAE